MKFAVIPWAEGFYNNEIFNVDSNTNKNGLAEPYAKMKEHLESNGHEINTIDKYADLCAVDFFLFFDWFPLWMHKLTQMGLASRMVYCNAEPPTVRKLNREEGYKKVKRYFPYIMTWNKELVDNDRIFYRTIPYNFEEHAVTVEYEKKKLLTSISANKTSDYVDELYTERERLISYFETEIPEEFDMFGVGWDKKKHPSYKGSPKSKFDTYENYKFALAFENTKNVKGYVTEKIFDCLTGNIVPVYYGADDITDYVSSECFIDYRKFGSLEELKHFLQVMPLDIYEGYLTAAKKVVTDEKVKHQFSGEMYADNIVFLADHARYSEFSVAVVDRIRLMLVANRKQIKAFVKRLWKSK